MMRQVGSARGATLLWLLFTGCADDAADAGFSAGQVTQTSADTPGAASTFGASSSSSAAASETSESAEAPESSGDSSGAAPTTGAPDTGGSTGDGGLGESGDPEIGATHGGTSTGGPVTTGGTTGGTTGDDTAGVPGFIADIWPILDAKCSCHKDANGAGQLRMTLEDAYINLLEPSEQLPAMMLTQPGSSDKSYLWHKLNDTQQDVGGKGKRMPPGGLLDPADLELIRQWLDSGAAP